MAVSLRVRTSTSAAEGVPERTPVPDSKLSHVGNEFPSDKVHVNERLS